ncbi:MAG: hypothetical protein B6D61_07070 [Bacteroidetes bacterium 4484_249]|nr:MAG: hypothetical protein B6D61_07070 [Bacteroidetes bacterium 4484_249]
MKTNQKPGILNFVLFVIVILLAAKCHYSGETIEGIPVTDSYNICKEDYFDFGKMITIGDPNDKFMISLPYNWAIQENYSDTMYGITASNIWDAGNNPEQLMLLSVTGYQTNDSLVTYFKNEIISLKQDKNIKVKELGEIDLKGHNCYWVKFENDDTGDKLINFVQYVKSYKRNEIYLLHSTVLSTDNYMDKICRLKQLANSFELVENNN